MRKIRFEKALCPFGSDLGKGEEMITRINEEGEEEEVDVHEIVEQQTPVKLIATEIGLFPMTEHTMPHKLFNLFIGHTNFPLTKTMCDKVAKVLGVEIYMTLSPYRFKIAVGKMFQEKDVMEEIKKVLTEDEIDSIDRFRELR